MIVVHFKFTTDVASKGFENQLIIDEVVNTGVFSGFHPVWFFNPAQNLTSAVLRLDVFKSVAAGFQRKFL